MTQSEALRILATGVNVFLTGEPGSGKTHTVNAYVQWLRERGIEPSVTASTGIAATHIQGMTIHSWSGIGVKEFLSEADIDAIASKEHVVRRIQRTNVLIIDEVSMLSGAVLTMVDSVCREVRHRPDDAFGGMQVVLVGDFFQLPPISRNNSAQFAFESPAWKELKLVACYLTEQHRQEDTKFLNVLGAIRSREWDQGTVSTIMTRETDGYELDEDIPRLYTHNADVDRINEEKLATLEGIGKTYRMSSEGAPPLIEALKRGCLSPEILTLKEGAVVMGTKNNPANGMTNGTLATVIGFEKGTNYPMIETFDGRTLTLSEVEWAVEEGGRSRAKIRQIPLRLAWAITVHKSQGMSMDAAAIDLSRAFEYGQGYVALSRVRSLAGLHILGWSEGAFQVHPEVGRKDDEFRSLSEEARIAFDQLEEAGERETLARSFIRFSGGTYEPEFKVFAEGGVSLPKAAKRSTYDATLELLKEGKSLEDIAKERNLTLGTICGHAEKLLAAGRIEKDLIQAAISDRLNASLPKIHTAFKKFPGKELTPIFAHLKGAYSFDELKLARLLIEEESVQEVW
ncbi:MAG: ATP-dependent DNA helicase PIF1 [Parcubacteria bacterium C7867-008]|nr:MAG: ATP-dependent DNA helicase PIF1 [Parcubacteria bacterium C7867-008]